MNPFSVVDGPDPVEVELFALGGQLVKQAEIDAPVPSYTLAGMLYASSSGWVLLSVPNALVRGVFAAIDETGIELPPSGPDGKLNAHISVFRKSEIEMLGGIDRVTERGKTFRYRIGGLVEVNPDGWPEMEKVYFLTVHSPELQELRRSYGLSSLPDEGRKQFHITCGVKRRGVLGRNEITKGT